MDQIAKYVSLVTAACFICTAALLFGRLYAADDLDLLTYLTFSDFVNFAPATLILNGLFIGLIAVIDAYMSLTKPPWRYIIGALYLCAFVLVVLVGGRAIIGFVGAAFIIATVVYASVHEWIRTALGDFGLLMLSSFTSLLLFALFFGFIDENRELDHGVRYELFYGSSSLQASSILPLDRGIAVVNRGRFAIIPWSQVKGICNSADHSSPLPQADTCAGLWF